MAKDAKNAQDEEMRTLAWELAGRTGSELSFIIDGKAKGQFSIGALERGQDNYFVRIHDDYLDQNHVVDIPEGVLRERGFTEQIKAANSIYDRKNQEEERAVQRKKQLRKSRLKKSLIFSAIGLAALGGGKMGYNYLNNPERLKRIEEERELDEMAVAIVPEEIAKQRYKIKSERQEYDLLDNNEVAVYLICNYSDEKTPSNEADRLLIIRNGLEEFISAGWSFDAQDDAMELSKYWKNVDGNWINIPVTDETQKEYRALIREIYTSKQVNGN